MDAQVAFAAAATLISLAFAFTTFDRWQIARRRHVLAWTWALFLFAAAAAALWFGAGTGWTSPTFRAFYYFGAIANVPVLALGTIELSASRRTAEISTKAVATFCVFGAGVMAVAPLTGTLNPNSLPRGADVFGPLPRILAAIGSSVGAIVILIGALLTIGRSLRSRRVTRPAVASAFIALGTIALSLGGLFNSVANEMTSFALSLVVGISLLFAGFIVGTASQPARLLSSVPPIVATITQASDHDSRLSG